MPFIVISLLNIQLLKYYIIKMTDTKTTSYNTSQNNYTIEESNLIK